MGSSVGRLEDELLVSGRGRFVDNLPVRDALRIVLVRSPFANARIEGIDPTRALATPGVVAVLTGLDLRAELAGPLPMIWPVGDQPNVPEHWPLAVDRARYPGDGVAVVLATSLAAAEDAAEVMDVQYEPMPAVMDVETAVDDAAPLVHESFDTNRCFELSFSVGDSERVFREADIVLRRTFRQQRLLPSPMETRAVLVEPRLAGEEFVVWTSTQVPHLVRRTLAPCVGIPEHRLRVVAPDVGGAFGGKLNVYAEEAIALALARRFGQPVKWVEERSESSMASTHGRGQLQRIEVAATAEGRLRGIRVSVLASMGAYLQLETPGIPIIGRFLFGGAYQAEAYEYRCTGVFTNETPTGAYRGAGRPEAAYAIERMMDVLARATGVDPAEIRRRNFLAAGEGVLNAAGIPYDSVDYDKALERALELAGYEQLRAEQARRRGVGDPRMLGIGIASYVDSSGIGPSAVLAKTNYLSGGWEFGRVRILPTGTVDVLTGTMASGQGHRTVFSQLVADVLGVPIEDVRVHQGDTAVVPMGVGSFGSRSLTVGGTAVLSAAEKVLAKARRIAAHELEVSEEDVEFHLGRFSVVGAPDRDLSIREVARAAYLAHRLPAGVEAGLEESTVFDPADWTYPFGAHVAAVEIDRDTGGVLILSYVAVDDCGRVVNPMIVDGQIQGGIAQGIGQALFEEVGYTADGQVETGTFLSYLVPGAPELPFFELARTTTPSPLNPLGVKGVGEAGTIAAPPAIMNAVHDALRTDEEIDMPATPEKIWRVLRAAGSATPSPTAAISPVS